MVFHIRRHSYGPGISGLNNRGVDKQALPSTIIHIMSEDQKLDGKYVMVTNLKDKTAPAFLRL
ncbi:MAG: hypothetical protein NC930_00695 [Candidatus Omnitrophica bacterium]|nr:hypothetical protein [Candidatus Omnitrophota bacterium]